MHGHHVVVDVPMSQWEKHGYFAAKGDCDDQVSQMLVYSTSSRNPDGWWLDMDTIGEHSLVANTPQCVPAASRTQRRRSTPPRRTESDH
jgi:hypothetical protein